jgi:hypothetical protein
VSLRARRGGGRTRAPVACFAVGVVSLWIFARIERTVASPLVVLDWFRTRNVALPVLSQTLLNFAYMGGSSSRRASCRRVSGSRSRRPGFLIIARPLVFSLVAPAAGLITIRVGERIAGVTGGTSSSPRWPAGPVVGASTPLWFIAVALGLSVPVSVPRSRRSRR